MSPHTQQSTCARAVMSSDHLRSPPRFSRALCHPSHIDTCQHACHTCICSCHHAYVAGTIHVCRSHMQITHADHTCRSHMQITHADHTCRSHMHITHAYHAFRRAPPTTCSTSCSTPSVRCVRISSWSRQELKALPQSITSNHVLYVAAQDTVPFNLTQISPEP